MFRQASSFHLQGPTFLGKTHRAFMINPLFASRFFFPSLIPHTVVRWIVAPPTTPWFYTFVVLTPCNAIPCPCCLHFQVFGLLIATVPGLHMHSVNIEMRPRPPWPAPISLIPLRLMSGNRYIIFCEVHSNKGDGCSKSRLEIWIKSSFAF